jgi:hypothetical protein
MPRNFVIFTSILALAALACGINVNPPQRVQPGPEVTDEISVPHPEADEINLRLSFGAGEMTLAPGAAALVEGSATYNYEQFKPRITADDGDVRIAISETPVNVLPSFDNLKNEWDFKLGSQPMNLTIEAGAYQGEFEFGGLALTSLTINDGAADVELDFSKPNPGEMTAFRYATGASSVRMKGLANANFSLFDFSSGAGNYTLDFSGELKRDASVKVETGFSNVIIIVPENVNAAVTVKEGLSNVSAGPSWSRSGNVYKQSGKGPTLTFIIEMGAGNLTLTR